MDSLTVFRQRAVDRHPFGPLTSLIPVLSCRACRPNAPFAELVRLADKSVADEQGLRMIGFGELGRHTQSLSLQTRTACTPCANTRRKRSAGWVAVLAALPLPAMSSQTVSAR
jgi:hypothetical protein